MSNALSITATVTVSDGTEHTVTTNTYDIYRAEKELGELQMMNGKPSFGDMAALIWSAARRGGFAGDDFELWLSEVEIDLGGTEEESPKED